MSVEPSIFTHIIPGFTHLAHITHEDAWGEWRTAATFEGVEVHTFPLRMHYTEAGDLILEGPVINQ